MNIEFKPGQAVENPAINICEVIIDGRVAATIYPNDNKNGIRIISRYHTKGRANRDTQTNMSTIEMDFAIP